MGTERFRTASTVALLTMVSILAKLLGFVREQVMAGKFGVSALTDAYVAAQVLPITLDTIIGAAIASILVPQLTATRMKSKEELAQFFYTSLVALGALYLVETVVLVFTAPYTMSVLVPGLSGEVMARSVDMAVIFAPSVGLVGMVGVYSALLSVHKHFLLPGIAALLPNAFLVVGTWLYWDRVTPEWMAGTMIAGMATQLLLLALNAMVLRLKASVFQLDFRALKEMWLLFVPLGLANCVGQISSLLDKYFASQMPAGTLAALNYASKLIQLPISVVLVGVVPVVFTRFARLSAEGDIPGVARELGRTLQGLLFVFLPVTALLAVLSGPVVSVVYGRGQFGASAVSMTSGALTYFSFGLFPLVVQPVLARALYALNNTRTQLFATCGNTITYICFALMAGPMLAHKGLALAFSMAQFAFVGVVAVALCRRLGCVPFVILGRSLPAAIAASTACLFSAWVAVQLLDSHWGELLLGSFVGLVVYLGVHFLLRSEEIRWILGAVQKAWR